MNEGNGERMGGRKCEQIPAKVELGTKRRKKSFFVVVFLYCWVRLVGWLGVSQRLQYRICVLDRKPQCVNSSSFSLSFKVFLLKTQKNLLLSLRMCVFIDKCFGVHGGYRDGGW